MKAEIICTGTELFLDEIANLNLTYLANWLMGHGYTPAFHTTVPDNMDYLVPAIQTALKRSNLIVITGGLGSTTDDITRFAIALAVRRELHFNNKAYQSIENYFRRLKRPVPPITRIQADLPEGSRVLANRLGTAPGFWLTSKNRIIIAVPGVPDELKDIWECQVSPRLRRLADKPTTLISPKFLIFGISEVKLQKQLNNLGFPHEVIPSITVTNNGVISLRLMVKSGNETQQLLDRSLSVVKGYLGSLIFGVQDDTMEGVVGQILIARRRTLSLAESSTGGLLSHRLTNIPGISRILKENIVCYSNESKIKRLHIPAEVIKKHGAVSAEVARLMARNISRQAKTDFGLSITGLAGPDGGTARKPVGLTYIGLHSTRHGRRGISEVKEYQFSGSRTMIKERAVTTALNLLRLKLISTPL